LSSSSGNASDLLMSFSSRQDAISVIMLIRGGS
jgi:hypothetical protein